MAKFPLESFLIDTVEGRPGAWSVTMQEGRLAWANEPSRRGAEPNAALLIDFLRSSQPIGADIRAYLADLLDPEGATEARLTMGWRARGRHADITANWPAAELVDDLVEGGIKQEAAIADAMARFAISRSTIMAALKSRRAALAEHEAMRRADLSD